MATATSLLDAETFSVSTQHDAAARVLTAVSPDGSEVHCSYDEGGGPQTVSLNHCGSVTEETVVGDISYDAQEPSTQGPARPTHEQLPIGAQPMTSDPSVVQKRPSENFPDFMLPEFPAEVSPHRNRTTDLMLSGTRHATFALLSMISSLLATACAHRPEREQGTTAPISEDDDQDKSSTAQVDPNPHITTDPEAQLIAMQHVRELLRPDEENAAMVDSGRVKCEPLFDDAPVDRYPWICSVPICAFGECLSVTVPVDLSGHAFELSFVQGNEFLPIPRTLDGCNGRGGCMVTVTPATASAIVLRRVADEGITLEREHYSGIVVMLAAAKSQGILVWTAWLDGYRGKSQFVTLMVDVDPETGQIIRYQADEVPARESWSRD